MEKDAASLAKKLANADFRARAPAEVVAKDDARAAALAADLERLRATLQRLQG
jgi:valyl-tRNA synthetase